jgi:alkanesulfonate monooxygenase SsuD/methylene tetrahydromethanopterin reductase-like flavin-dependent oxidoreductase (luciferase family)
VRTAAHAEDDPTANDRGTFVRFGIFYEHQLPRPWTEDSERQLIQDALDQVELADRLGIDYVWEVEHHFLEEYSHSSAPEVFLAAASQRTTNIRLGHGIIQTAPQYNHPARTAERVAMLDLVSNGRVEFGSGESSSEAELGGFAIEYAEKRAAWLEGLDVAVRCMTETPFTGHEGTYCSMPPRNVVPKPVQKPHPPLWVACSRRDTILLAAEKGIGALTFAFIDPEEAEQWIGDYERTMAERCVPVGQAVNPNVACVTPMMCHPDEATAIERGLEGGNFFGYSLAHFYVFGEHIPAQTDVWQEFQEKRGQLGYSPEAAIAARQETLGAKAAAGDESGLRGAVGTPDQIREFLRRYEEAGVDQVIFVMQAGRNRHEDIMESLELLATEVMPEFKERDPAHQEAKAKRYAPIIEAAMARKVDTAPPMPDGYVMKAIPKKMVDAMENEQGQQWLEKVAERTATGERDDNYQRTILGG